MDSIEDVKSEISELVEFLDDSYFGENKSINQKNLVIELVVLKMTKLAEHKDLQL